MASSRWGMGTDMGYTLHWDHTSNFTKAEWLELRKAAQILFAHAMGEGIKLAEEYNRPEQPPCVDDNYISFNGVGDEGHETFMLSRTRESESRHFCKTARKPYNKICMGMLMVAQTIKGGKRLKFRADGGNADPDYMEARAWVRSIFPTVDDGKGDPLIIGAFEGNAIQVGDGHE